MSIKENILHAGLSLLKNKGVASLTQPQVAKAAGCKQSHLTYYFPTRNNLLLAIAEFAVESILAELAARLAEKPRGQTLAEAVVDNVIEGLPPRVILGLIVAADADLAIRDALGRLIAQVRGNIRALLERAGLAYDDEAALLFHAVVVGLAVMHQARLSADSEREIEAGIRAVIEHLTLRSSDDKGGGDHVEA
ncbi:MAG: TetR/AcrR family transcriptional regulator [Gammaproteobacteria bacterium]